MELSPAMREAIKVNAERSHFQEAYEGFNDCPAAYTWSGAERKPCDCGKDEAEAAWAEVQEIEARESILDERDEADLRLDEIEGRIPEVVAMSSEGGVAKALRLRAAANLAKEAYHVANVFVYDDEQARTGGHFVRREGVTDEQVARADALMHRVVKDVFDVEPKETV